MTATTNPDDDDIRLSRSGRTDVAGKLTCRLDVPISEELEAAVISMATIAGMPKAEWVRKQLERNVFGELGMLRRIAGQGPSGQSEESRSYGA